MIRLVRPSTAPYAALAAAGAGAIGLRRASLRWGATELELDETLPGDEVLGQADLVSTRAITIRSSAKSVWPWIAQLGQGRAGFYSYDFLENLVGCGIHSADQVEERWQDLGVGDPVRLHPDVPMTAVVVEPGRALVLRGGVPMGEVAAPYDMTWAFVLSDVAGGGSRLVVRERYRYERWWARLLVEPVELVSFLMSQRMLHGIKTRAERAEVLS
jgi:hypothetical protein